jgi:hypothetical protein
VTGVVLNEFAAIAKRKLGFGWEEVLEALAAIRVPCPSVHDDKGAGGEEAFAVQRYWFAPGAAGSTPKQ